MRESNYSIIIANRAKEELNAILEYISEVFYAETTAEKTLTEIEKSFERLKLFPYSAPLMREQEYKELGIHRLVVKNYSVFYRVNDEKLQIEIIHILHGMQDYLKIL